MRNSLFRFVWLAAMLPLALVASALTQSQSELAEMARGIDGVCPIDLGTQGLMSNVKYYERDNEVEIVLSVSDVMSFMLEDRAMWNDVRENIKVALCGDACRALVSAVVKADASLNYVYLLPGSSTPVEFKFSRTQMRDLYNHPLTDSQQAAIQMKNMLAFCNKMAPMATGTGLTMTKLAIVDGKVTYFMKIDPSMMSLREFRNNAATLKNNMKNMFGDLTLRTEATIMYKAGYGMAYRYYDSTGSVDVGLTRSELGKALGLY